jgi:hypothetical protein
MTGFGGNTVNITNDDTQFTVLDQNNQPAPGLFGNAFHDDFAAIHGVYKPTFAWSPSQTGTYKLLVTKYESFPGCQELGSGERVTVAFRRISQTYNFAVWTGASNANWFADYCWLSRGQSGQPGFGLNTDLTQSYVLLDNDHGSSLGAIHTSRPPSDSMSITVFNMIIGPRQTLEIYPKTALVITGKLDMMMEWPAFALTPTVGTIKGSSPSSPGTIQITGTNARMYLKNAGTLENIRLVLQSGQNTFIEGAGSVFEGESSFTEIELRGTAPLYVGGKIRVLNKIHFYNDQIISIGNADPYSYLKLGANTQVIGAGANRFISTAGGRPLIKEWASSQPFVLHLGSVIGNSKYYAPISIDPTYSTFEEWHCGHSRQNPHYHAYPRNGGIDHISRYDRWFISTEHANVSAKVSFQWHPGSYVSHQLQDLVIAGYDYNWAWQNLGGNNASGGIQTGIITSNTFTPNNYREFSLASTTSNHNFRLGQQPTADISLNCYPNPASSQTQIKLDQPLAQSLTIRLIDAQGKQVRTLEIPEGHTEANVQLHGLSSGLYYLMTSDRNNLFPPLKLIKE